MRGVEPKAPVDAKQTKSPSKKTSALPLRILAAGAASAGTRGLTCLFCGKRPFLFGQYLAQKPELRLNFCGIGHGIGDFLAQELAIPLAQPVNGYLERSF